MTAKQSNIEPNRVHTKVSREDWLDGALTALQDQPIDQLKVLNLAQQLGVSRSSFYWYFQSPDEFRAELLNIWEHNTTSIVERTQRHSASITSACLGVFECWADPALYHSALDLAVRDWGRRDAKIGAQVLEADATRLDALAQMFLAHGFNAADAVVRARLLYHSQVGYYATGTAEPMEDRLAYLPHYLEAMTGFSPTTAELTQFSHFISTMDE